MDLWITNSGVVYDIVRADDGASDAKLSGRLASKTRGPVERATISRQTVSVSFLGASARASANGSGRLEQYHNYYVGADRVRWAENVPLYTRARLQELYDGIDAVFYLDEGRPRYDLIVAPGAEPADIRMKIDGARSVRVAPSGALVIDTELGVVEQRELHTYQRIGGINRTVRSSFVVDRQGTVGFKLGEYDRRLPLVVDPLVWSTYLGGTNSDEVLGLTIDGDANVYVTGETFSSNFPTQSALQSGLAGSSDAFVTKFNANGTIAYSTYLGGAATTAWGNYDKGTDIDVDGSGNVYVVGTAHSADFPTLNAIKSSLGSDDETDAFIAKLSASGTLSYSTYFGGSHIDYGYGIEVDGNGNAYAVGVTHSGDLLTTTGAYVTTSIPGVSYGYLVKLTSTGGRSYCTYFHDGIFDVALDANANMYVCGITHMNTYDDGPSLIDTVDAVVTRLTSAGAHSFTHRFGGSRGEVAFAVGADNSGNAYVTGVTHSSNFPTQNAAQSAANGLQEAFVMKLTSSGSVSYSTYLGGSGDDGAHGIFVDASGNAVVTGYTGSYTILFPTTTDAHDQSNRGANDAFITRYTSAGSMAFSTLIGAGSHEIPHGVAMDGNGYYYVGGRTQSSAYPVQNAAQSSFGGVADGFITKLYPSASLSQVSLSGTSPYCAGTSVTVGWTSSGVSSVNIDLSTDDGATWSAIATAQPSATTGGTYAWSVTNAPGTNRRVRVRNATNGAMTASTAAFAINAGPSVVTYPSISPSGPVCPGTSVTLSVEAAGTPAPTIQWERSANGLSYTTIPGATGASYTFSATLVLNGYRFRPVISNSCGATSTSGVLLSVSDAIPPTITAPGPLTVSADDGSCAATNVVLGSPLAEDDCSVASITNDAPPSFPLGVTTVTWTATDVAGNIATAEQFVIVVDDQPPTIAAPADIAVSATTGTCEATPSLGTPTASDNCGTPTLTNDGPASYPVGTTIVTWTATDAAGNTNSATQSVTVTDNEAPTLSLVSSAELRSPTHAYHTFDVDDLVTAVSDNCSSLSADDVTIWKVTSDEPEDDHADGSTLDDIVIASDCRSVELRAERQADGNGRVYRIYVSATDASGNQSSTASYYTVSVPRGTTVVDDGVASYEETCVGLSKPVAGELGRGYLLMQNEPNPFGTTTAINYTVPLPSQVTLAVYDAAGARVAMIVDAFTPAGAHTARFDGSGLASGTYAYVLTANGVVLGRTMVLVR